MIARYANMPFKRRCTLWVHDERFSEEQTIMNISLFEQIVPGDLLIISPSGIDSSLRKVPDKLSTSKCAHDHWSGKRLNKNCDSTSFGRAGKLNVEQDSNLGTGYLFVARTCPKDATPGLEISVSRHIADTFGLKHRSVVFISKVSYSLNLSRLTCIY